MGPSSSAVLPLTGTACDKRSTIGRAMIHRHRRLRGPPTLEKCAAARRWQANTRPGNRNRGSACEDDGILPHTTRHIQRTAPRHGLVRYETHQQRMRLAHTGDRLCRPARVPTLLIRTGNRRPLLFHSVPAARPTDRALGGTQSSGVLGMWNVQVAPPVARQTVSVTSKPLPVAHLRLARIAPTVVKHTGLSALRP